jgi:osmotically-inducible protein OsmY
MSRDLPDDGSREYRVWATDEVRQMDTVVLDRVLDELTQLSVTLGSGRVRVSVQNQVVILRGEVDSEDTRTAVVRRTWATPGVADVCNRILADRRRPY